MTAKITAFHAAPIALVARMEPETVLHVLLVSSLIVPISKIVSARLIALT